MSTGKDPGSGTIGVFRNQAELELIRERTGSVDVLYLALTPEADYLGESEGLNYVTIENLVDQTDLELTGVARFADAMELCEAMDRIWQEEFFRIPGINSEEQSPLHLHLLLPELKRFLDIFLIQSRSWEAVFDQFSPERILIGSIPRNIHSYRDLLSSKRKWEYFLSVIAPTFHVRLEELGERARPQKVPAASLSFRQGLYSCLTGILQYTPKLAQVFARWRSKSGMEARNARQKRLHLAEILLDIDDPSRRKYFYEVMDLGLGIAQLEHRGEAEVLSLQKCIEASRRKSRSTIYLRIVLNRILRRAWRRMRREISWQIYLNSSRLGEKLLCSFVESFIQVHLRQQINSYLKIRDVIGELQPDSVLLASGGLQAQAVRDGGSIAVMMYHAPALGHFEHRISDFDYYLNFDQILCPGPAGVRYLERRSFAGLPDRLLRPSGVFVGSPALERIKQRSRIPERKAGKSALYISSAFSSNYRYLSNNCYPDVALWRLQREVVRVCGEHPNVQLTVKLLDVPGLKNPLESWIQRAGIRNCRVVTRGLLAEMINEYDLLIIDYAATPLMEAAATDRPVILHVMTPFNQLTAEAIELVSKRVEYCPAQPEFLKTIDDWMAKDSWVLDSGPNDEFLAAFGGVQPGADAVQRFANYLARSSN